MHAHLFQQVPIQMEHAVNGTQNLGGLVPVMPDSTRIITKLLILPPKERLLTASASFNGDLVVFHISKTPKQSTPNN
jgi:hypothetical protein